MVSSYELIPEMVMSIWENAWVGSKSFQNDPDSCNQGLSWGIRSSRWLLRKPI